MRIAMWSGPRNLSTAMMYAFGARSDCAVVDEPFYAAYLANSGLDHPMRAEILASHDANPERVTQQVLGPIPGNMPHYYQKHLTHHLAGGVDRGWMADMTNVFLIRHPARVVASYALKHELPSQDDVGLRQQAELYDHALALGQSPVVIDAQDIRHDPKAALTSLCQRIGLPFQDQMLSWPKGGRAEDGVWAAHWYGAVHRSTGFAGPEGPLPSLDGKAAQLARDLLPYYRRLQAVKLG